ncbi:MAG TPA: arylesterase [Vicinamibacterales bacterium]|jgi:acyl-CoA thioesterase-1|nr:arylesterase [Vicinamibacterales bacterium]
MRCFRAAALVAAAALAIAPGACRRAPAGTTAATAATDVSPAAQPVEDSRPKIVALGDSLTAGLGLPESQSYPSLLQADLDRGGYHFDVVNAGVSGDTSAAGLARLDWTLQSGNVKILILELGANDGLRGLPVAQMQQNLARIIERAHEQHIAVLLLGMEAPPNYGVEYARSFRQVYRDLASRYETTLVPFMLDGVAGRADLNQADGIHPNTAGTQIVARTIWQRLKPLVDAADAS